MITVNIPRDYLVAAVDAAIERVRTLTPAQAERLREAAQTTKAVGENFNTNPACVAGQAYAWPFQDHGCSLAEHNALVSFGITLDGRIRAAGLPTDFNVAVIV